MRSTRFFYVLCLLMSAVLPIVLLSFSPASATTITVQALGDGTANVTNCPGAGCRLRDAIASASPGDTIDFSVTGTISITTAAAPFLIDQDLTIKGNGTTSLTVSGNNVSGVFVIVNGNVNISGITIRDGSAPGAGGGGIGNGGTLTLTEVAITGNSAYTGGGLYNLGTATLTNVTLSGNSALAGPGGGIYSSGGSIALTDSTLSENSAVSGGGIFNGNLATLTNVTISGNSATDGSGGGIYNAAGIVLTNVTLSGNSATGVGGGIFISGSITTLKNTIVANSTSGGNCSGAVNSLGYNLGDDTANTCGFSTAMHDFVNTNPLLGPLALNAPGTTGTFALLAGSPAINAIPPGTNGCGTTVTIDQRGVSRPQGTNCDIGAYELEYALPTSVPTMTGWGLIVFFAIAGLWSVFYLRRRARA